jgi:hypothetical protein
LNPQRLICADNMSELRWLSALVLLGAQDVAADSPVVDPYDGAHTECAMRRLGYEHGLQLQPQRAAENPQHMVELFDALQLHTLCGDAHPILEEVKAAGERLLQQRLGSSGGSQRRGDMNKSFALHVLPHPLAKRGARPPSTSSDASTFGTVHDAVTAWRALGSPQSMPIVLHSGIHFLNNTLEFGEVDSGLQITSAVETERPTAWLSGGVPLTGLEWKPAKLPHLQRTPDAIGKVFVADIANELIDDITGLFSIDPDDSSPTTRLTRARYPNGDWELDMWGLCSTGECLDIGPAYTTPGR